ncbi:MAG: hypothetical protein LBQ59_05660 [Candidatus Peribacteria bacterium]|nr:hypothetical protein [Candidatus Peribacteria bacterium]
MILNQVQDDAVTHSFPPRGEGYCFLLNQVQDDAVTYPLLPCGEEYCFLLNQVQDDAVTCHSDKYQNQLNYSILSIF